MIRQTNTMRAGMKLLKWLPMLLMSAVLWGCGGGDSDAGTSLFAPESGGAETSTTADLLLDLSKSTIVNTGSDSVIITATALDAGRATVSGAKIVVSADSDAIVTTPSTETGADGKLQSTLTIGSNRANRVITVKITSGSVSKTATVQVLGAALTATALPTVVSPSAQGKIQYRLLDQANNPMVGQDIQVVAVGLSPANAAGKTGANGEFEFAYVAPATSGTYEVIATAGGATTTPATTISVQASSTVPKADMTKVTSTSVSANPSVVGTNVSTSGNNISTIRALVLGTSNTPIPNVRVRFDLNGDVNTIGGTFSTEDTTLNTDANGVVTTNYIPGSRSSPTNGVSVRACFFGSDETAAAATRDANGKLSDCPLAQIVTLTVTSEPLGVSIGTNELIIVNELTYVKKFIVSVVDAAGVAKPDVNLVVSVDLPQYRKGFYAVPPLGDTWTKTGLLPSGDAAVCANEDKNRNGVLEADENLNGAIPYPDGSFNTRLDPGKSDVSVTLLHAKTRADGTAELQLQYAKSFATWVDAKITVAASGVSGTEGRATYLVAPVSADAASFKNVDVAPAYVVSPYGVSSSCTNPN